MYKFDLQTLKINIILLDLTKPGFRTSNSLTLTACILTTQYAIDLQFSPTSFNVLCNNRSKFESDSIELWCFKITNL